jgi:hypothetical protein
LCIYIYIILILLLLLLVLFVLVILVVLVILFEFVLVIVVHVLVVGFVVSYHHDMFPSGASSLEAKAPVAAVVPSAEAAEAAEVESDSTAEEPKVASPEKDLGEVRGRKIKSKNEGETKENGGFALFSSIETEKKRGFRLIQVRTIRLKQQESRSKHPKQGLNID